MKDGHSMDNKLSINAPIFAEFKAGLEACIENMLATMVKKDTSYGTISAKLSFELTEKDLLDPETGEAGTVFIPTIEHKVSCKIGISAGETKGTYNASSIALQSTDGKWICKNISGQTSLFK